jgi:hypothetical protein
LLHAGGRGTDGSAMSRFQRDDGEERRLPWPGQAPFEPRSHLRRARSTAAGSFNRGRCPYLAASLTGRARRHPPDRGRFTGSRIFLDRCRGERYPLPSRSTSSDNLQVLVLQASEPAPSEDRRSDVRIIAMSA